MRRKRILITGGSGFIGSYLVERLFRQNDIVSFDRIDAGYNVEFLRRRYGRELDESVSFVRGDIRNKADVEGVVFNFKPDIIFHLASVAGVNAVIKKPFETMETNVIGSYNLLQCLRDVPPERLVFTSTSEVYGPLTFRGTEDGFTTQGSPYDFRWSYSTSKLSVEHMCVSFEKECKVPIAIARPFNIYGPRQIGEGAIHRFVVNCLKREQMKIYGEGD